LRNTCFFSVTLFSQSSAIITGVLKVKGVRNDRKNAYFAHDPAVQRRVWMLKIGARAVMPIDFVAERGP
jgi:hypothetical protein